jgi:hypothetical protein
MRPRSFFRAAAIVFSFTFALAAESILAADETAVLRNDGEPMRVAHACKEADLQWAGMACGPDDPCPIYLELSAVVSDGRKIFVSGNLHSTSATLNSVLLMSDDGGATWKEPAPRVRGAALDQLQFGAQFGDAQLGWAAGETQFPLPRDPFFLLTSDGGESWRELAVGEEGTPGVIQRFWFDSAQRGDLIVDAGKTSAGGRYLSYESRTGGESWEIRGKSDRLPAIRGASPPENPDYRLRPSQDGKTYRIEKRTGEKWEPFASFLIEVANCRIEPGQLKEPGPLETNPR